MRTKDFIDKLMDYEEGEFKDPELMDDLLYTTIKNGYSMANLLNSLEQLKYQTNIINKLVYENNN